MRVMDAAHHCVLWRDDHWVQRHNNGIADRDSGSHGLSWLHHLSCTCGRGPRCIVDARNRGCGSAGIRARRALPVSRDPFVLSWKDIFSMHQCSCFNESSSHIWTTCAFFPPNNFDGELHITSGKCLWWRDYWHLRTRFWTRLQHGLMALVSLLLIIQR